MRPYQHEAVEAVEAAWSRGLRRPAVVLPTGAGKTVVFSHLVQRRIAARGGAWNGRRALVLAHRTELIEQAADKIRAVAPDLTVGIVKAQRNGTLADVVVASVQTLRSENRRRQLVGVDLVVVDECHHAVAQSYLTILDHFGCMTDGAQAVGFTATMSRGDDLALGDVWQDVVYVKPIAEMIAAGWLVRPRGKRIRVDDLDLSKVRRSRGDYSEAGLGAALEASLAPEAIAKAVSEHASDRPTLLFAPTVKSATVIGDAVREAGHSTALVHGEMATTERRAALEAFSAGQTQVLANCMVLTEGTDLPRASCAVIARPTTNRGLYVQMVGRVLRLWPGKTDALVLDVVGASQRHALAASVELFGEDRAELVDDELTELDVESDAELDDGELTLDAGGLGFDDDPGVNGPLVSEDVDLFHGSASAWCRTYGGTWFLPAGPDRYIALLGGWEPGTYDVVSCHTRQVGQSRWIMRGVADLSYAMAWAEGDVTPAERTLARKDRPWRAGVPSPKTVALATRLGLIAAPGEMAGELSSRITTALASARIDPYVPAWARR